MKFILKKSERHFLFILLLLITGNVYAQNKYGSATVKIQASPLDIPGIAKTIAAQTGLKYSLNMQNASLKKKVLLKPGTWKLSLLLQQVHQQTGLHYKIIGEHILFLDPPAQKQESKVVSPVNSPVKTPATSSLTQNSNKEKTFENPGRELVTAGTVVQQQLEKKEQQAQEQQTKQEGQETKQQNAQLKQQEGRKDQTKQEEQETKQQNALLKQQEESKKQLQQEGGKDQHQQTTKQEVLKDQVQQRKQQTEQKQKDQISPKDRTGKHTQELSTQRSKEGSTFINIKHPDLFRQTSARKIVVAEIVTKADERNVRKSVEVLTKDVSRQSSISKQKDLSSINKQKDLSSRDHAPGGSTRRSSGRGVGGGGSNGGGRIRINTGGSSGTGNSSWYKPVLRAGVAINEISYVGVQAEGGIKALYGIASYGTDFKKSGFRYGAGTGWSINETQQLHFTFSTGQASEAFEVKASRDDTLSSNVDLKETLNRFGIGWSQTWDNKFVLNIQLHYNLLAKDFKATRPPGSSAVDPLSEGFDDRYYILKPPYKMQSSVGAASSRKSWIGLQLSFLYTLF